MGRPSVEVWLLLCLVAVAGCNGAAPLRATPATTTIVSTSTTAPADTPAEQILQLTYNLPQPYRDACHQLLAYGPVGAAACPPLVPQGPLEVHAAGPIAPDGYARSFVLELWQCMHDHWTGQLFPDEACGEPIATILTTIGQDSSASEAADGIKAIYRMLRTERETA